jgi:hypothetical protein
MGEEDARNVAEILDVVSEKIPTLLRGIKDAFLSEEAGRSFGKAGGAFYQELVAAGIPAKEAQEMTSDYVRTMQEALSNGLRINTKGDE